MNFTVVTDLYSDLVSRSYAQIRAQPQARKCSSSFPKFAPLKLLLSGSYVLLIATYTTRYTIISGFW